MKTNIEYLQDQVKYTGFGNTLDIPIQEGVEKGDEQFRVPFSKLVNGDYVFAQLQFKKSETTGNYFFQNYRLQTDVHGQPVEHTIYINNKPLKQGEENAPRNFTLKEAYNLLHGRPVLKTMEWDNKVDTKWRTLLVMEEQENGTWVMLKEADQANFKMRSYPENYVDLDSEVRKLNPKDLKNSVTYDNLLNSIRRGNVASCTLISGENEYRRQLELSMQFRTLLIHKPNSEIQNTVSKEQEAARVVALHNGKERAQKNGLNEPDIRGEAEQRVSPDSQKKNTASKKGKDSKETAKPGAARRRPKKISH